MNNFTGAYSIIMLRKDKTRTRTLMTWRHEISGCRYAHTVQCIILNIQEKTNMYQIFIVDFNDRIGSFLVIAIGYSMSSKLEAKWLCYENYQVFDVNHMFRFSNKISFTESLVKNNGEVCNPKNIRNKILIWRYIGFWQKSNWL